MPDRIIVPSKLDPANAAVDVTLDAGEPWLYLIRRGETFRIVDLCGNQAVDTFFFSAADTAERYSATDTIASAGNIYLTTGTKLVSNLGRPLLTITADTCGRHDTLGGACSTESNTIRYSLDKRYMHACRQSFLKAIASSDYPLTKRDIGSNINFFMNVPVTPEGNLEFADGISEPGKYVEMQADLESDAGSPADLASRSIPACLNEY